MSAVAGVGCCTKLLYDLLLRRSFRVLRSTAAFLVTAGFLVVWLLLDVRGFRPILARG
jgi:hypothetical protein